MTALGVGSVVTVLTYIAPILIKITGFSERAVSPILLLFGLGFVAGNTVGGRLADRRLVASASTAVIASSWFLERKTAPSGISERKPT